MRLPRLFLDRPLAEGQRLILAPEPTHYLLHVLRARVGTSLMVFNGQGGQYLAHVVSATAKTSQVQIVHYDPVERESPLALTLVQAISRPQHMDYTIQKAVELGVQQMVPVITERSPPLPVAKRHSHWQKIIISACEQCGRNRLPHLHPSQSLAQWLSQPQEGRCLVCAPQAKNSLLDMLAPALPLTLLVGAEGGFTGEELRQAQQAGYTGVSLGPRVLRTETVAVAVLAVCQAVVGDWRS